MRSHTACPTKWLEMDQHLSPDLAEAHVDQRHSPLLKEHAPPEMVTPTRQFKTVVSKASRFRATSSGKSAHCPVKSVTGRPMSCASNSRYVADLPMMDIGSRHASSGHQSTAIAVIDRDFQHRAKLIDLAAFLDRCERAEGSDDFRSTLRAAIPCSLMGSQSGPAGCWSPSAIPPASPFPKPRARGPQRLGGIFLMHIDPHAHMVSDNRRL